MIISAPILSVWLASLGMAFMVGWCARRGERVLPVAKVQMGDDRAAVRVPVHDPRAAAAGQRHAHDQSGDM